MSNGTYLFHQEDKENLIFYGILYGKISLRINVNTKEVTYDDLHENPNKYIPIYDVNKPGKILYYEFEKVILNEGNFFGENSIINHRPRNATAVAIGETELIFLRENNFRSCFNVFFINYYFREV